MDAAVIFNERNREFFDKTARLAFSRALASGQPMRALRNAAKLGAVARRQKVQAEKRSGAALRGRTVPGILIASVTRRCNLDCAGCYSKTLRGTSSEELSDARFLELFQEAADLGVGTLMLAGGEPLLRRSLIEGAAKIPGIVIPVFTNGSLVDDAYLDLFSTGRVFPIFSVEGDSAFTAERRGAGIHETVLHHAVELKKRGALFGFSVTLTSKNADEVLSDRFLREVQALGAAVLFLIEFVPVAPGCDSLVLEDRQKRELDRKGKFDGYKFMAVSLPGDEESFGGCLAAGRGFLHIADDGSVEACPFAPFSDASVAETSLREALDSPLMKAIRERHDELTETKGGCALWNKRGWAAAIGACAERTAEPAEVL